MMRAAREEVLLVLVLIIWSLPITAVTGECDPETRAPDPEYDISGGCDVPIWSVGDYWNYSTSFTYTVFGLDIPFTGWVNMSVVTLSLDPFHGMDPVYITNMSGNISGHFSFPPLGIKEDIYMDVTGYIWTRVQDLSVYRMVLNATVSGTQEDLNGNYTFGAEYSPPLEQYDFPLVPDEEWETNVTVTAPFDPSEGPFWLPANYTCGDVGAITVPAGQFQVYPISTGDDIVLWYNVSAANSVKRVIPVDLGDIVLDIPLELEQWERNGDEGDIEIWVSSDQHVQAGAQFTISGKGSSPGSVVTILFPGGRTADIIPISAGPGTFQSTLTAPEEPDNTPTDIDWGSFGILAFSVGTSDGYDVCTITTKATDIELREGSLRVKWTGEGTRDDDFTAHCRIFNPSNFKAESFIVSLLMEEEDGPSVEVNRTRELTLEAHEELEMEFMLPVEEPGNHSLTLFLDPDGGMEEYNETNNIITVNFEVLPRPPLMRSYSTPPGNISMDEGEALEITANVSRDGEVVRGTWSLDGVNLSTSNDFLFNSSYLGQNSSEGSPYVIRHILSEQDVFPDENTVARWNLTVEHIDLPPVIEGYYPENRTVRILEGNNITFDVMARDPDGDNLTYEWRIDGIPPGVNTPIFNYGSDYLGPNSSTGSPRVIEVLIGYEDSSGPKAVMNWTLSIVDVDRPMNVILDPLPGSITLNHTEWMILSFNASDPDGDPIMFKWTYDGTEITDSTAISVPPHDPGIVLDITLNLTSGGVSQEFVWDLTYVEGPENETQRETPPPKGVVILSPSEGQEIEEGEVFVLRMEHSDTRLLELNWFIVEKENVSAFLLFQGKQDGNVEGYYHSSYSGNGINVTYLPPGEYTVFLNASSVHYATGQLVYHVHSMASVNITITPADDAGETTSTADDEDRGFPWWLLVAIAGGIMFAAGFVAFLLLREGSETWEE